MSLEKLKEHRRSLSNLLQNFDWQQTREGVSRESRARIVFMGLPGVGKSSLLNQLCGWTVSAPADAGTTAQKELPVSQTETTEDFGLFCLVDLLAAPGEYSSVGVYEGLYPFGSLNGLGPESLYNLGRDGYERDLSLDGLDPLALAEGADLLVYVLDAGQGVSAADYRWVGRLRRLGLPLVVVLNKSDLLADELELTVCKAEAEKRLAATVLPVSALTGANVAEELLPKLINTCPNLTVALGRELGSFRSQAAERLIARTALLNGLVSLEPVPLLDLPVQIMTLTGLILRIAAIYDRPPTESRRRELAAAVVGGLAGRYGAQQLAKLIPGVGWAVSSFVGWSATWALGRAAIAYFEVGGDAAIDRNWNWTKYRLQQGLRSMHRRWQQRPRLRLELQSPARDEAEPAQTSSTSEGEI